MRHALGIMGVLAAAVLLAVSAAMNWRFGYTLGKTEFDGQIYGAASAAADCMKALVPFFFFAAIRNKMWSQAAASAVVWVVVTAYSLTSALGHAALNRLDTAGQRAADTQSYSDMRADLKRAQEQLSWVPQHRPAATVQSDINNAKNQRAWTFTTGCTQVSGKQGRDFCQQYHGFNAELASAQNAGRLETRIAEIQAKLGATQGHTVSTEADPQAAVLAKLTTLNVDTVQTAMTIFIALLLEIGSGFGMYIAFSQWRLYDSYAPAKPVVTPVALEPVAVEVPIVAELPALPAAAEVPALPPAEVAKPRISANDNKVASVQRMIAPENDVEKYYKERIEAQDGSTVTATEMYEDYCAWCEGKDKEPLALPTFGRQFGDLGIQKSRIAGRTRYIGIALKAELEEDKKLPLPIVQAA